MSETKSRKSGRTAEQQAARDARKAAKKAAAASSAAEAATEAGATNDTKDTGDAEAAGERTSRKRPAEDDADLLEIDMSAGAPLSKAEARAAKKRAKRGEEPLPPKRSAGEEKEKAKKAGGEDSEEDEGGRKRETKPQAKGEFSIWIGNLAFRTTAEGLKEFIVNGVVESGGEADCVTRVHMPKKEGKGTFAANKGFAYVDFKTDALRLLALGLTERPLDGRRVLIKAGDDHKPKPDARTPKQLPSGPGSMGPQVLAKQKHGESATLFIGNLPFDVTEDELRDLVEGNAEAAPAEEEEEAEGEEAEGEGEGEAKPQPNSRRGVKSGLIKTRLAQFEDTGRCKGFAFWDFKTPAQAKAALMNRRNHSLRGRRLNLQFASVEATQRSGAAKKKLREQEERDGLRAPRRDRERERPAKKPRYFEGGEEEGGYEARNPHAGAGDFQSEKDAASRIAAMVASGGGGGDERPERRGPPGKKWEQSGRPRPGAALAMAKREKVGIVESTGNKVTFD